MVLKSAIIHKHRFGVPYSSTAPPAGVLNACMWLSRGDGGGVVYSFCFCLWGTCCDLVLTVTNKVCFFCCCCLPVVFIDFQWCPTHFPVLLFQFFVSIHTYLLNTTVVKGGKDGGQRSRCGSVELRCAYEINVIACCCCSCWLSDVLRSGIYSVIVIH